VYFCFCRSAREEVRLISRRLGKKGRSNKVAVK
jgi:hypothetical protein